MGSPNTELDQFKDWLEGSYWAEKYSLSSPSKGTNQISYRVGTELNNLGAFCREVAQQGWILSQTKEAGYTVLLFYRDNSSRHAKPAQWNFFAVFSLTILVLATQILINFGPSLFPIFQQSVAGSPPINPSEPNTMDPPSL